MTINPKRDEFLKKFYEERKYLPQNINNSNRNNFPIKSRTDFLYLQSKLLQQKKEQNSKVNEQKKIDEQPECIPLYPSQRAKQEFKGNSNLYNRNQMLEKKKQALIEKKRKENKQNEFEECFFSPMIRDDEQINWEIFKGDATSRVCDPESYDAYIYRMKSKREKDQQLHEELSHKPGTGNVWKNKFVHIKNSSTSSHRQMKRSQSCKDTQTDKFFENKYNYENAIKYLHKQILEINTDI